MRDRASDVYEVVLEQQLLIFRTGFRTWFGQAVVWSLGIVGSLLGDKELGSDPSAVHFHLVVRDRAARTVVHDQDWGEDESGARDALTKIAADLKRLNVAGFRKEYLPG